MIGILLLVIWVVATLAKGSAKVFARHRVLPVDATPTGSAIVDGPDS